MSSGHVRYGETRTPTITPSVMAADSDAAVFVTHRVAVLDNDDCGLTAITVNRLVNLWPHVYDPEGHFDQIDGYCASALTETALDSRNRILAALHNSGGGAGTLTIKIMNTGRAAAWANLYCPSVAWFYEADTFTVTVPVSESDDTITYPTTTPQMLGDLLWATCLFTGTVTFEPENGTLPTRRWVIPTTGNLVLCPDVRAARHSTLREYDTALIEATAYGLLV